MSENLNNAQVDLPESEDRKDNIQRVQEPRPSPISAAMRAQFEKDRIMVRFVGNVRRQFNSFFIAK